MALSITAISGFAVERDNASTQLLGPTFTWHTYGAPWEWRTAGLRIETESTESDVWYGHDYGYDSYAFDGVDWGVFLADAAVWFIVSLIPAALAVGAVWATVRRASLRRSSERPS